MLHGGDLELLGTASMISDCRSLDQSLKPQRTSKSRTRSVRPGGLGISTSRRLTATSASDHGDGHDQSHAYPPFAVESAAAW